MVAARRGRGGTGNAGWVVLGSQWGLVWPDERVPKVAAPSWQKQRYPDLYPDNLEPSCTVVGLVALATYLDLAEEHKYNAYLPTLADK